MNERASSDIPWVSWYARHFNVLLALVFAGGFALLLASGFIGRGGDIITGDALGTFEYARSLMTMGHLPIPYVKYPCGVPMIGILGYAPVMWLSRVAMSGGLIEGGRAWLLGNSLPQQIAYCIPMIVLSYVAVRANVAMLRGLGYGEGVSRTTALFWIVSTNVGFYMLKEPAMSESPTYAALSLYYAGLVIWFYRPDGTPAPDVPMATWIRRAVFVGFFLGLSGSIRQQNILHCVAVPLLFYTQRTRLFGSSVASWQRAIGLIAVVAVVSGLVFSVPYLAWWATLGKARLFMYNNEEHFNWTSPQPLNALFHPGYHGLFFWNPAFLVAAIGMVAFIRRHRSLAAAWLVPMLIQYYLISAWYWLSYGASIGHRGFFTIFPLLLPGFAAALDWGVRKGKARQSVAALWTLTIANAAVVLLILVHKMGDGLRPPL
jgi:hypothetical protein